MPASNGRCHVVAEFQGGGWPGNGGQEEVSSIGERLSIYVVSTRDGVQKPLCETSKLHIRFGQNPRRGPLVDGYRFRNRGEFRQHLSGAGTGANDGNTLPVKIDILIPNRWMEHLARKVVSTSDFCKFRTMELSNCKDDALSVPEMARTRDDVPPAGVILKSSTSHLSIETKMLQQPKVLRHLVEVAENLALWREPLVSVTIRGKGKRVEMRGHVAGAAWVSVVSPDASNIWALFKKDKVVDICLFESHGHGDASEAGSDDEDFGFGGHGQVNMNQAQFNPRANSSPIPFGCPSGASASCTHRKAYKQALSLLSEPRTSDPLYKCPVPAILRALLTGIAIRPS